MKSCWGLEFTRLTCHSIRRPESGGEQLEVTPADGVRHGFEVKAALGGGGLAGEREAKASWAGAKRTEVRRQRTAQRTEVRGLRVEVEGGGQRSEVGGQRAEGRGARGEG